MPYHAICVLSAVKETAMIFPVRCLVFACVFVLAAGAARAEAPVREFLQKRHAEKVEGGEAGGMLSSLLNGEGEGKTCAAHKMRLDKLLSGPLGKRAFGPKGDVHNVAYGAHARNKLDIFKPKMRIGNEPAPIIIMVHGGGWCVGDKALKSTTAHKVERWTPKGFMFIAVNYPMIADGYDAYAQGAEIARAVAFVQAHARDWGGDPDRIILMGHSAGAHLVSLVSADAEIRKKTGMRQVLGTISIDAGAVDVPVQMPKTVAPLKLRYKEAFGAAPEEWTRASPYHLVDESASPWLGICSTTRPDEICTQTQSYVDKSRRLGVMADILPLAKSHGALNSELGTPGSYTAAVEKFMAQLDPAVKKRLQP